MFVLLHSLGRRARLGVSRLDRRLFRRHRHESTTDTQAATRSMRVLFRQVSVGDRPDNSGNLVVEFDTRVLETLADARGWSPVQRADAVTALLNQFQVTLMHCVESGDFMEASDEVLEPLQALQHHCGTLGVIASAEQIGALCESIQQRDPAQCVEATHRLMDEWAHVRPKLERYASVTATR